MLKNLFLKEIYDSNSDDLLEDFLIPVLKESVAYDRTVGYWSSQIFYHSAVGLSSFIKRSGKIRLIIGHITNNDDYDALMKGYNIEKITEKYGEGYVEEFDKFNDDLHNFRIDCLSWLIASGQLEIKIGMRKDGLLHAKHGIFRDEDHNSLSFYGSGNDSRNAFAGFNYEELLTFPSWKNYSLNNVKHATKKFENLWNNIEPNTIVLPLPKVTKSYFVERSKNINQDLTPEKELQLYNDLVTRIKIGSKSDEPAIPKQYNGFDFKIACHQRKALNKWKVNGNYKGILALATGTGKTLTAIYGLVKLYEYKKYLSAVIVVPYKNLGDQWIEELERNFNISPIKCYETHSQWSEKLDKKIVEFRKRTIKFFAIVVVKNTLVTSKFQNLISNLDSEHMILIGDECHWYGSKNYNKALPSARYRIGLSATPDHYLDDEKNLRLENYFGKPVYEFSLEKAIRKGILCPYEYHLIPVRLTHDEQEEYREISQEISRYSSFASGLYDDVLGSLLSRRSRLLGNAENKIQALRSLLQKESSEPYTLFYCAEGSSPLDNENDNDDLISDDAPRQINEVSELLEQQGWEVSRFTSHENPRERKLILSTFKDASIHALVAMKCLDEGIDIPLCKRAFILASNRNPRQFIQRRGRILRKHSEKEKAIIFDFFVTIPTFDHECKYDRKLIEEELKRVKEFSELSLNHHDTYMSLRDILIEHELEEFL